MANRPVTDSRSTSVKGKLKGIYAKVLLDRARTGGGKFLGGKFLGGLLVTVSGLAVFKGVLRLVCVVVDDRSTACPAGAIAVNSKQPFSRLLV